MAEEVVNELAEAKNESSGAEPPGSTGADPAAVAVALGAVRKDDPELNRRAGDYLDRQGELVEKQSRLVDLQIRHFELEHRLAIGAARRRRFSERLRNAFLLLSFLAAVSLVVVLAAFAWRAHQSHGLVFEALQTPPDVAARGINGTAASSMLIDRLNDLVASADNSSLRRAATIARDWGEDIKVEIPETGLSLDDAQRQLRRWLGRDTRVSGEIYHAGAGLALRLRTEEGESISVRSDTGDVEALLDAAAERLFAKTQPYRYAMVLRSQGKLDEAERVLREDTRSENVDEQAWAYQGLYLVFLQRGELRTAVRMGWRAITLNPQLVTAYPLSESYLGHPEQALQGARSALAIIRHGHNRELSPAGLKWFELVARVVASELTGAYLEAAPLQQAFYDLPFEAHFQKYSSIDAAWCYAMAHDPAGAEALLRTGPQMDDGAVLLDSALNGLYTPRFFIAVTKSDWRSAVADFEHADQVIADVPAVREVREAFVWPWLAYAYARAGRNEEADALIARTPLDCNACLRMRGGIATARGDWAGAERWYAEAVKQAPSVPMADTEWGGMLLAKGDLSQAIRHFASAHEKGPRYADPLEMWGEALLMQGKAAEAAAKFGDAARFAPRWGRLHLKWGEALARSGKTDDARARFQAAGQMHLTPEERAELAAQRV